MLVYKVLRLEEAEEYDRAGEAPLSAADAADGYVHLSTAAQLPGTLEKHFADVRAVRVLAIETGRLGDALRWEEARGGDSFPHLYGRLKSEHAVEGWLLGRGHGDRFRLPKEIGG